MALEVRPTLQNMVVFQVLTVALLGGLVFMSTRDPSRYYYSPIYNDHHAEYGGKAMACSDCHSKPFTAVANPDCTNSECHPRYQPEYRGFSTAVIHDANWISLQRDSPEKLRDARIENASLVYHHAPPIAALNCRDCHNSHVPPPDGMPMRYDHHAKGYGGGDASCIACHGPSQAPPIVAHEEVLKEGSGIDCFTCHQSGESWTKSVEWAGRPATSTYEDGLMLLADRSVSYRSIADAAPAMPALPAATPAAAVPEPTEAPTPVAATPEPTAEPTPEPAVEPTPPMFITPTPAATEAAPPATPAETPSFATPVEIAPFATPVEVAPFATPVEESPFADPNVTPTPRPQPTSTPVPTATPVQTPTPTPSPTPVRPKYEWNKFWEPYDPAVGLNARDGKPVIVLFAHPGVADSRRFEIFAAEMQDIMALIDEDMAPVRVDMSKYRDVGDSYGVVGAPTLARMRDNATLHSKQLFGGYPTEEEIRAFLTAP